MKKIKNLLLSILIGLSMIPVIPVYAQESDEVSNVIVEEDQNVARALEKWQGSRTFTLGGRSVTIVATATQAGSVFSCYAYVSSGNATVISYYADTSASTVYGNVSVGGVIYAYSVRVYPI